MGLQQQALPRVAGMDAWRRWDGMGSDEMGSDEMGWDVVRQGKMGWVE